MSATPDPLTRFDELLALGMEAVVCPIPGGWQTVTTIKNPEHASLVPEFVTLTVLFRELLD